MKLNRMMVVCGKEVIGTESVGTFEVTGPESTSDKVGVHEKQLEQRHQAEKHDEKTEAEEIGKVAAGVAPGGGKGNLFVAKVAVENVPGHEEGATGAPHKRSDDGNNVGRKSDDEDQHKNQLDAQPAAAINAAAFLAGIPWHAFHFENSAVDAVLDARQNDDVDQDAEDDDVLREDRENGRQHGLPLGFEQFLVTVQLGWKSAPSNYGNDNEGHHLQAAEGASQTIEPRMGEKVNHTSQRQQFGIVARR